LDLDSYDDARCCLVVAPPLQRRSVMTLLWLLHHAWYVWAVVAGMFVAAFIGSHRRETDASYFD